MKKFFMLGIITCCLIAGIAFTYNYFFTKKVFSKDCPNCNVVFILIDTLRADHLPFYDYPINTSPFLDSLAKKSTVFERAFSSSSWTAPATTSIFTSLYPSQHGVITGFMATQKLQKEFPDMELNQIPPNINTLPEYMKAAGFQTIGVADNINIGKEIGFDRGFDDFRKFVYNGAPTVNAKVKEFMEPRINKKDSSPYFLYIHYMDPHAPYNRRSPWYEECLEKTNTSKPQKVICAYDSEIRYLDDYIKELADHYNWLDNSIIIVTSDHGEEFWEHGYKGHGSTLYKEVIHVPLMIYHPKGKGQRIKRKVHTMDLLPTLADITGIKKNPTWEGRSLGDFLEGKQAWQDRRVILSERLRAEEHPSPEFRSIVHRDMHYIQTEKKQTILKQELFNIEKDFVEKHDLCEEQKSVVDDYAFILAKDYTFSPLSTPNKVSIEMDEKLDKQLRTLGYF